MIQEQILENENNTNVTRGTEAVVAEEYPPNDTMERSEGESRRAIQLSDHFTTGKLLRYTLPSMIMMVFTSIYGVIDGYFVLPNSSTFRLGRARFSGHDLAKVCGNGSSELMSNIAMSLVSMLYNTQLLRYIGQDGIAAYGVLMYVNLIFLAVFIGFSVGTAPVISFHYGAQHHDELHGILTKSFRIIAVFAACMYFAAEGLSDPLARLYVGYDERLLALTKRAFFYFAFSFLFAGFSIFSSSLFTALNNGAISAAISFLRALVFQVLAVLMLPIVLGTDGIWLSIVVAEVAALIVSAVFLLRNRTRYGY